MLLGYSPNTGISVLVASFIETFCFKQWMVDYSYFHLEDGERVARMQRI